LLLTSGRIVKITFTEQSGAKSAMSKISERLKHIEDKIQSACERSGRDREEVRLAVVVKPAALEDIKQILQCGICDLAENNAQRLKEFSEYVNELLSKSRSTKMPSRVNWHMIGRLHRNKLASILPAASLIHSVDTLRVAEDVNSCAAKQNRCAYVLIQVNASRQPQKYGVPIAAVTHLVEQLNTLENLRLAGLMTMAPLTRDKNAIRRCFARTRDLLTEIRRKKIADADFAHLSMGMSSDYEIAVEEGATILRLGSAIFAGS